MTMTQGANKFTQNVDTALIAVSALTVEVYSAGLRHLGFSVFHTQQPPAVTATIGLVVVAHPGRPVIPVGTGLPERTVVVDADADRVWLQWVLDGSSAVVIDGRLSIEDQLRSVAEVLGTGPDRERSLRSRSLLRRRLDEAARLETLTPRERVVLRSLAAGSSPAGVARAETVALSTVRAQVRSIHDKLQVTSLGEVLAMARRSSRLPEINGREAGRRD